MAGSPVIAGRRYHFIGAGGVGMSGLAALMLKENAIITGSDICKSSLTDRLCDLGADIRIGHNPSHIPPEADAVVISAAIREDNPELKLARQKGLIVYKYAQMLGLIMSRYDGIAVAGTHGKSTTSGWLAYVMKQAGLEPIFIIGADILQLGCSCGIGESRIFIAEACEYDRSFLNLKPKIAVVLNIEQDHLDYYRDESEIVEAFAGFADGLRSKGVLIISGQDPNTVKIAASLRGGNREIRTFGIGADFDFSADNVRMGKTSTQFDLFQQGRDLGTATIKLPGEHSVRNALAVIAVSVTAGLEPAAVLRHLGRFVGMDRRLMVKSQTAGITVVDDYAHHPTEIKASLRAIRQRFAPARIFCVFQPHQYSRTRFLLDDFADSFSLADVTVVPEIYFVRDSEESKKLVNSGMLVDKIVAGGGNAIFIDSFSGICDYIKANVKSGDLVVTMGAGDIWKVADEYIQWLGTNS